MGKSMTYSVMNAVDKIPRLVELLKNANLY